MTAQVVMSQHPFPSAFSSPVATPSPSKENQVPLFPAFTMQSADAGASSSRDAGPSRPPANTNHTQEPPTYRAPEPRRTSRPRLRSLQSLNSAPATPSLTEQDSGNAFISTARFHPFHPSLSRASSRNAVETLQPLAESSIVTGKHRATAFHENEAEVPSRSPPLSNALPSRARRCSTSPTQDSGLSEFGQMGAPFAESSRSGASNDVSARFRNFQTNTGAFLRRSHTITAGISSVGQARIDETPPRPSPPSSSAVTYGPSSGRSAPKLVQRRQTVSNVSPDSITERLSVRAGNAVSPAPSRTLSYTQTSPNAVSGSSLSVSTTSPARLRERGALPNNQLEAKVVILGSQGVGKTSLVHRYTSGQFHIASTPSTIGASFLTKKLIVDGVKVRLQLWDTAGQERFRSMAPMYYRGSHAAVIVYDITSMSSFMDVRAWIEELKRNMRGELVMHVVGAKADLGGKREVELRFARQTVMGWLQPFETPDSPTLKTVKSAARSLKPASSAGSSGSASSVEEVLWDAVEVSEVSAKDDEGIEEVFLAVTKKLVERKGQIELEQRLKARDSVFLGSGDEEQEREAAIETSSWTCC